MKNLFSLVLFASLFFLGGIASAQTIEEERANKREERKSAVETARREKAEAQDQINELVRENREERRTYLGEQRDLKKAELLEKRKARMEAYFERVMKRLTWALERMERIVGRIESRLERLTEKGVNTTIAKEKLAVARLKIAEGKTAIQTAEDQITVLLESDTPKELFPSVKTLIGEVIQKIKDARKALVETLREVKATNPPENENTGNDTQTE